MNVSTAEIRKPSTVHCGSLVNITLGDYGAKTIDKKVPSSHINKNSSSALSFDHKYLVMFSVALAAADNLEATGMDDVGKRLSDHVNFASWSIGHLGSHTGQYYPQIAFGPLALAVVPKSLLSGKESHIGKCVGIPEVVVPTNALRTDRTDRT